MSIDGLFEKYPNNIFGFRLNNMIKVIDFWVKKDWVLNASVEKGFEVKQQKTEDGDLLYYIAYSADLSFVELFNCVAEIIEYNLDKEKKTQLFNEKIQELKKMFLEGNYDDLKKMDFKINTEEKLD
jgi:hypothetical protein